MEVAFCAGIMEYGIKVHLVDFDHCQNVAGDSLLDLDMFLALELVKVADLEGLASIPDEEQAIGLDRTLVNPEDAEFTGEGVGLDLEAMGDYMIVSLEGDFDGFGGFAFSLEEMGVVAFEGSRQETLDDLQELIDSCAGLGGDEADGDQMAFPEALFEGVVKLMGLEVVSLFEVEIH
jgi:hypothetical protein